MNFRQFYNEHVAQAWERMKSMVKNCPTHGLTTWISVLKFLSSTLPSSPSNPVMAPHFTCP